ncbi:hypothetical protein [Chromobacterium piscinae]
MQDLKPINSPDSLFHDGNPATGELGTIVAADWLNGVQSAAQELLTVIKNSGQTLDSRRQDQLLQAIQSIAWGGNSKPTTLTGYGIAVASQAEAEAGTDNVKAMTPLRVEQALNAAGLSGYAKNIASGSLQTVRPNGLYHVDAFGQVSGAPEKKQRHAADKLPQRQMGQPGLLDVGRRHLRTAAARRQLAALDQAAENRTAKHAGRLRHYRRCQQDRPAKSGQRSGGRRARRAEHLARTGGGAGQ